MSAIIFNKRIGPVPIDVVVSEDHTSEIEITSIPIENGAEINDHAYVVGKSVRLKVLDTKAAVTHAALIRFQETRQPFTLITGLRVYKNMLIKRIGAARTKQTSFVLDSDVELQEVLIVDTASMSTDTFGMEIRGDPEFRTKPLASSHATDFVTRTRAAGLVQRGDSPINPSDNITALTALTRLMGF